MRFVLLTTLLLATPALATTTYDLRPLAEVAPEYAPLQEALERGRMQQARSLAAALAAETTQTAVMQAAWYVLHRRCLVGKARCPVDVDETSAPFVQSMLLARVRAAIRRGAHASAAAVLSHADPGLRETNRLLLTLAERSPALAQSAEFRSRLGQIERWLSRRDRCRLLLILGDSGADNSAKWAAYRQVWKGRCGPLRRAALERLIALGMTPSPIERVQWLAKGRLPRKARTRRKAERLILREIERVASGVSGLATFGRAVLWARSRKRREKALRLFDQAINHARDADVLAAAQYGSGDLLGRLGRDKEAIARIEPLLDMRLSGSLAADVRWRLFRLYRAVENWLDAERMLNWLVAKPNSHRRLALWELGWRRFRLDDMPEAISLLRKLRQTVQPGEDDGKQPWLARIDYWLGRGLARSGRKDEAIEKYISVARSYPHTYYGIMATDRLAALKPVEAARLAPEALPTSDHPLALTALRVQRSPRLDAAALFVRMGLWRLARDSLRAIVPARLPRDGVHMLAALYHKTGRPRAAYSLLRRHARRAAAPDATTASVWRVAYATPLKAHFIAAADAANVPRALLYAVARHESHFVTNARSPAGAIGLVQLLPIVARRIADLYEIKKQRRGLWRPGYNLAIGARYLAQLRSYLRDNHALVLAAYNAGPYAVRRWLKSAGDVATDVFVESIPYPQARNYARGVLATARAYALLHPEWSEAGRLAAGRKPRVPAQLGPFMVAPAAADQTAAAASRRALAAPREAR